MEVVSLVLEFGRDRARNLRSGEARFRFERIGSTGIGVVVDPLPIVHDVAKLVAPAGVQRQRRGPPALPVALHRMRGGIPTVEFSDDAGSFNVDVFGQRERYLDAIVRERLFGDDRDLPR
jgi:hypothetical protein